MSELAIRDLIPSGPVKIEIPLTVQATAHNDHPAPHELTEEERWRIEHPTNASAQEVVQQRAATQAAGASAVERMAARDRTACYGEGGAPVALQPWWKLSNAEAGAYRSYRAGSQSDWLAFNQQRALNGQPPVAPPGRGDEGRMAALRFQPTHPPLPAEAVTFAQLTRPEKEQLASCLRRSGSEAEGLIQFNAVRASATPRRPPLVGASPGALLDPSELDELRGILWPGEPKPPGAE